MKTFHGSNVPIPRMTRMPYTRPYLQLQHRHQQLHVWHCLCLSKQVVPGKW
jgi:hypothetical protein